MRIASAAHALFAATLVALGIQGLVQGDFTAIWQPVSTGVPGREGLVYLCALICLAGGLGLLWRRAAALAARVLLGYLLLWMSLDKLPVIFRAPAVEVSYESWGETAVIVSAAWVLYVWFANGWDRKLLGFAIGESGLRLARLLYALALIAFGLSHFFYAKDTAGLVPRWLPSHLGFAYFTGGAYLAAGFGVIIGAQARLAAALAAIQMGLFTLLVWAPMVAAGSKDPAVWSETVLSWVLTVSAWVVTDSYRITGVLSSSASFATSQKLSDR
jgi:uncharacterized membrane protein